MKNDAHYFSAIKKKLNEQIRGFVQPINTFVIPFFYTYKIGLTWISALKCTNLNKK